MKKYLIQDSENWLSGFVYNTIEEAKERIEWFKNEHYWKSAEHFTIFELNTRYNTINEIECVSNEKEDEK